MRFSTGARFVAIVWRALEPHIEYHAAATDDELSESELKVVL